MIIDGKGAERIAKDLIREIASEWVNTPITRCVEENGSYIFECTLEPGLVIRYARKVERPIAPSVFRFDPLAEATEIVIDCAFTLEQRAPTMTELIIRINAKPRIRQMVVSAPDVFTDAMWQARIVGDTLHSLETLQPFGRPDIARGLINSTVAMIENRVRDRFGKVRQKQKPKISQFSLSTTLKTFFPTFEETGQIPSQRQFAKALGVTAKGWRDYLKKHQLGKHHSIVKRWLEELLSSTWNAER